MVVSSESQIHGLKLNDIPAQLLGKYMSLHVMGNCPTCEESKVIPDIAGHGKDSSRFPPLDCSVEAAQLEGPKISMATEQLGTH